ncbi:3-dehydroquinate synthase [Planctomicrobium piriforme]|uniref:3-dehydroquinate synthase n=1 Tax=Planctomicrobium piriforme TaxID=1576369 RepID=A0A1I3JTT1_9PLAN|nr:3-dehydroquinate synthase [Planctomicrobium piriforme]SFI63662.1 3-dehydroquinate synthase [Planctomicrobium piriforme]
MPVVTETDHHRVVSVSLGERSYDIVVGNGVLASVGTAIPDWVNRRFNRTAAGSALIVTDSNVVRHATVVEERLQHAGWRTACFEMPPGEQSKRLEIISSAWDRLVEMQADRQTVVIAVGGGVVGDAAGFIAATFARGIPFVQIPTTLLADVDSSVGGKVGINHPQAKNLIGAFHQPLGVLIDTRALDTLPDREYRSGLAEVVKYGVILDAPFFEFLERNVTELNCRDPHAVAYAISRSCELKARVVEEDEYELTGLRAILNYGHTYAHAFEALTGYGELLHGEAVAIGMAYASRLSELCGRTDAALTKRQTALLGALKLPTNVPNPTAILGKDVIHRMQLDKKTLGGQLRFVLPTRLGHVELVKNVPTELVWQTLHQGGIE